MLLVDGIYVKSIKSRSTLRFKQRSFQVESPLPVDYLGSGEMLHVKPHPLCPFPGGEMNGYQKYGH